MRRLNVEVAQSCRKNAILHEDGHSKIQLTFEKSVHEFKEKP